MKICYSCKKEKEEHLCIKNKNLCKECQRKYNKNFYNKNQEKEKLRAKDYRINNLEKSKQSQAKWRKKNKETIKEKKREDRIKNPEKHAFNIKRWRSKNKEHVKEYSKLYSKEHPEVRRAHEAKRRAAKKNSCGKFTKKDIRLLFKSQKGKCVSCPSKLKNGYHIDHRIALSKGGSNDKKNIQLLCVKCNLQKRAKDPIDFMQEKGFLL